MSARPPEVYTPSSAADAVTLELVTEELGAHRQQLALLTERQAELHAALDRDGDGRPDIAAAAPRLRALVVIALGAMALGGYALTPTPDSSALEWLYFLLGSLGALGVGEAALVARALGRSDRG